MTSRPSDAVDAAIRARKLAPAQREWAEAYAARDPAGFAAWVATATDVFIQGELGSDADAPMPKREGLFDPRDVVLDAAAKLDRALRRGVADRSERPQLERVIRAVRTMATYHDRVTELRGLTAAADELVGKPGPHPIRSADEQRRDRLLQSYEAARAEVAASQKDRRRKMPLRVTRSLHAKKAALSETQLARDAERLGLHFTYSKAVRRPV